MVMANKKQQAEEKEQDEGQAPNSPGTEMKQYSAGAPTTESNYFEDYGNTATQTALVGALLKFSKGDWLKGKDEDPVDEGSRFTAIMDRLEIGWIKWEDSKPAAYNMGKLVEGFKPPRRKDLGDENEDDWDVDEQTGKPRDPWQFSNHLILREVGTTGEDDDDLYTFATSSRGGINAIGDLCKNFGKIFRMKPDEWPIVEIGVDKYKHSNKAFGVIKVPTFTIVGWEPKSPPAKVARLPARGKPAAPPPPPAAAGRRSAR